MKHNQFSDIFLSNGLINIRGEVMKIIYHIGEKIGAETIVKKGFLTEDTQCMYIESNNIKIVLDNINSVEFIKINSLGTMVQIKNYSDTIFLAVPRIFIDKGTGFAIINYFKTKKAGHLLKLAMQYQEK